MSGHQNNSASEEKQREPVISEVNGRLVISGHLIHLANSGVVGAQMMLAKIHRSKNPQLRDLDKAVRWLRAAAEQGTIEAQLELGKLFQLGEEVIRDFEKAARFYCDAALLGSEEGAYRLGMMFYMGTSIERDLVSAYAWFSLAYRNGRRDVRLLLKNIRKQLTPEEKQEGDRLFERIQKLA